MSWRFTPDEFALAWETMGFDRYPYPLSVRPSARTVDERDAIRERLRPRLVEMLDGDFDVAVRILTKPQTLIEVFGFEGPDDSRPVRVLGGWVGQTSVVARQESGPTSDCGGDISINLGKRATLAAEIIAALPRQKVGSEPARTAPLVEVQSSSKDVVLSSVKTKSVAGQMRRILNKPRVGVGQILVTGRLDESTERPPHALTWVDVANDGRYVVRTREDLDIMPAADDVFAAQLRRVIEESRKRD